MDLRFKTILVNNFWYFIVFYFNILQVLFMLLLYIFLTI